MFNNKLKLIFSAITLSYLIILGNSIFAYCTMSSNINGLNFDALYTVPGSNEAQFNLNYTQEIQDDLSISVTPECYTDYNLVTLNLLSPITFKMVNNKNTIDFNIDVNVFNLQGNNIIIVVDNDEINQSFTSSFNLNVPKIKNSVGDSIIKIYENEVRPNSKTNKGPFGVGLKLNDVEISTGASLDLILTASDAEDDTSSNNVGGGGRSDDFLNKYFDFNMSENPINKYDSIISNYYIHSGDGVNGGKTILEINDIYNYGNLNIIMNSGNGGEGNSGKKNGNKVGGFGGSGGSLEFYVNNIYNNAELDLNLNSGNGARGGKGSKGKCAQHNAAASGNGGMGGPLVFDVCNIYNYIDASIDLNLNGGFGGQGRDGGNGVDCSFPISDKDPDDGGHGGFGGIVYIDTLNLIYNQGYIDWIAVAGDAGNGGSDGKKGTKDKGNGGFGGFISDLLIERLENSNIESKFYLTFISGKLGIKGENGHGGVDGRPGNTGDLNVNYLINKTQNMLVTTKVNESKEDFVRQFTCCLLNQNELTRSGNIIINYLDSGSYLPRTLKSVNNNPVDDSKIQITGCYVSPSEKDSLEYQAGFFNLDSVNGGQILNSFNYENSKIPVFINNNTLECPYCDIMDMDSEYRLNHDFAIYSNVDGNIEINDLNIFYATESNPSVPFALPSNITMPYVVYSNKNVLTAVTSNIDSNLYQYNITKSDLFVPNDSGDGFINEDDKLYCPAQQYYIKVKITKNDASIVNIEFPFVPLYNLD